MQLLATAALVSAGKTCAKCGMSAHGGVCKMKAGGPGSGRHTEVGSMERLANQHKSHSGMCNLNNRVCRAYTDMRIKHPGFDPKGPREPFKGK